MGKQTNEESNILFYIAGNGGPQFISFNNFENLYAHDLQSVIEQMNFQNLLLLIDTQYSSFMITPTLSQNKKILALTATSDEDKSSYAVYCPPDEIVNGKHIQTCLGEMFSSHLIEYA